MLFRSQDAFFQMKNCVSGNGDQHEGGLKWRSREGGLEVQEMRPVEVILWTAIYCGVALVGFVIAALLHFAFKKEGDEK